MPVENSSTNVIHYVIDKNLIKECDRIPAVKERVSSLTSLFTIIAYIIYLYYLSAQNVNV